MSDSHNGRKQEQKYHKQKPEIYQQYIKWKGRSHRTDHNMIGKSSLESTEIKQQWPQRRMQIKNGNKCACGEQLEGIKWKVSASLCSMPSKIPKWMNLCIYCSKVCFSFFLMLSITFNGCSNCSLLVASESRGDHNTTRCVEFLSLPQLINLQRQKAAV